MIQLHCIDGHLYRKQIEILKNAGIELFDTDGQRLLTGEENRYEQPLTARIVTNDYELPLNSIVGFLRPQDMQEKLKAMGGIGPVGFDILLNYSIKNGLIIPEYSRLNGGDPNTREMAMENYISEAGFVPLVSLRYRRSELVVACQKYDLKELAGNFSINDDNPLQTIADFSKANDGVSIASEYSYIARHFLEQANVKIKTGGVFETTGKTESWGIRDKDKGIDVGPADLIVETKETGTVLRTKGYNIVSHILYSYPFYVTTQEYYKQNKDEIELFKDVIIKAREKTPGINQ